MPKLPRDLFMIMRVITLLRGVLASLHVHDVSSALLWRPLALQVLSSLTYQPSKPPSPSKSMIHATAPAPASPRTPTASSPKKAIPKQLVAPDTPTVLLAGS